MKDIHIGDKLPLYPETFFNTDNGSGKDKQPLIGTVVYIHPKRRYFTAEFKGGVREAFCFSVLEEKENDGDR